MHVMLRGKLSQCLLSANRFQGHPGLKRRGMVSSWSSHRICSFRYRNVQQISHSSSCPKIPSHLCQHGQLRTLTGLVRILSKYLIVMVAVLGSNQWPLPCETEVGCLRINDMREEG